MKILFHLNSLGRGGAERVVSILSGEFIKLGHEVVIATEWQSEDEYPTAPGVIRIHAGLHAEDERKGRISRIFLRYLRLRKCVTAQKPDVVISFCNKANFRCAAALQGTGIPLIVSVRNDPVKDYAPYRFSTWLMERAAAGCVFQTKDAQAFFGRKLREKSCIIVNPVSEQYTGRAFHYSAPIAENTVKNIISVGRITPQKNFLFLVRSFRLIADRVPEAQLLIYGDVQEEEYAQELRKEIRSAGLEEKVHLMGLSDHVAAELEKAYMFVLSSDYEGMPNALLEAMTMGLPCVATDCPCGGPSTLIENGKTGILVPVGDEKAMAEAMLQLFKAPALAEELAENASLIRQKVMPACVAEEWMRFIAGRIR